MALIRLKIYSNCGSLKYKDISLFHHVIDKSDGDLAVENDRKVPVDDVRIRVKGDLSLLFIRHFTLSE